MRRPLALAALLLICQSTAEAQSLSARFRNLFTFGDCGEPLCLNVETVGGHGSHYIPSVTQGENDMFRFISGSIATALGNLPFVTASSGITYRVVDGELIATSVSSGSIFAERSQTLGRRVLVAGVSFNAMSMDNIRGRSLDDLTFRFAHQNVGAAEMGDPRFENDIIEVRTQLDFDLFAASSYISYGLFDNVDIGVLIPLVRASLNGVSEANVLPFDSTTPHLFGTPTAPSQFADAGDDGSAFGVGDIAVRVKVNVYQRDAIGLALAAAVRLPTGDSENFLGSGETAVRAIGIVSGRSGNFSPHLNAGFALRTGDTQNSSLVAIAGFDHLLAERATLAVDLIGDYELGEPRLHLTEFVEFDVPARRRVRLTDILPGKDHLLDASVGIKLQLPNDIRTITNLLVPLVDGGLRPNFLFTLGLERTF